MSQTKEKTVTDQTRQDAGQEVARLAPTRLPYHPLVEDRFGIDRSGWKALVEAVFPLAKSADSIIMALSYCKARKLDPFKRAVHIVPMWNSQVGSMVDTVWPGIAELRTTAFRTHKFAGMDAAEFGPMQTQTFTGKTKKGDTVSATVSFPEWCRITVYRTMGGVRVSFVGPQVYWLETYGRQGTTDVPNDMWQKRPRGQIEKVAEASALRRAFPEEIGGEYAAEEMEGQRLSAQPMRDITPEAADTTSRLAAQPRTEPAAQGFSPEHVERETAEVAASEPEPEVTADGEIIDAADDEREPLTASYISGRNARKRGTSIKAVPSDLSQHDHADWLAGWNEADADMRSGKGA